MVQERTRIEVDTEEDSSWLDRVDWRTTVLLMLGIFALRVIYLIWLSPWEIIEDEAHYWEWSRRLGLSYYSKGPGVALLIAASTALFGVSEWAVRLPAAVSSLVASLVLARLTIDATGDERAGFFAAIAFNLIAIFQLQGQLMTIDPPFVASWLICAWIAWRAFAAHQRGDTPWLLWALLGFAFGLGFLVKYVIVLLAPGLLLFAFLRRRKLPWDRRMNAAIVLALVCFIVTLTPWLIWNAENGWPAVRHELGHLGAPGGDIPSQWHEPHGIPSMLELLGAQIGVLGPPAFVLILLATVHAIRRREISPGDWPRRAFMLCCGLPTLAFFFVLALLTSVQGNWPVSGYLTLLVLVGERLAVELPRWRKRRRRWLQQAEAARSAGVKSAAKPRSVWVGGWRWLIAWGLVTATIVAWPHGWARLPMIGDAVPLWRIEGGRELAAEVHDAGRDLHERTGEDALVIGGAWGVTSQLAFYLPERPTVFSGESYMGWRESQYDLWEETDLRNPDLIGRPAVLVRGEAEEWLAAFSFDGFETVQEDPPLHTAIEYRGLVE